MGTIPRWDRSPSVGLRPTTPFMDAGHVTDPSVSVPRPPGARSAAMAAPVPELDPHAVRSNTCGLRVRPPAALQPLVDWLERKFAHSLRFVLPRITAPPARNAATAGATSPAKLAASASEPAVVG